MKVFFCKPNFPGFLVSFSGVVSRWIFKWSFNSQPDGDFRDVEHPRFTFKIPQGKKLEETIVEIHIVDSSKKHEQVRAQFSESIYKVFRFLEAPQGLKEVKREVSPEENPSPENVPEPNKTFTFTIPTLFEFMWLRFLGFSHFERNKEHELLSTLEVISELKGIIQ